MRGDRPVHRPLPDQRARIGGRDDHSTGAQLYLATVPAAELNDPHHTWVSYYAVDAAGNWQHKTTYVLPAHTLVTSRSTSSTVDSGLRNPFIAQATGTAAGPSCSTASRPWRSTPTPPHTCSRSRRSGLSVPLEGVPASAKNLVPQRAVPAEQRPRDDLVHVPHAGQGSVSLAVLRALRRRIHRGLRRADADRRLHGRLHQGRMSERSRALERGRQATTGVTSCCCGWSRT